MCEINTTIVQSMILYPHIQDLFCLSFSGALRPATWGEYISDKCTPPKKDVQDIAISLNVIDFSTEMVNSSVFWLTHVFRTRITTFIFRSSLNRPSKHVQLKYFEYVLGVDLPV